ncbi:hypothetical protein HGM15179_014718 [Zosterops borbonicus]|uniref:Major facilitator superfamily (MFS) profile domain-containing protein n=1 Tax=Zosterops borbonicus TaxID=364589 RepID=A0A8K1LG03_9PASS|nr:hypothetical protein HGM15179_014718 [Zosterops borbonicus]
MVTAPKEAENAIGLEEIHAERKAPPKGQKTFTVEEAVETIGFGRFHIMLFLIMGSTGVVEAMEIMLIAVVSPLIQCEWQLQDWQVALVTTMVFFGYMVFSIVLGLLADRYGRWKILLLSFLWAAYFSLLTSFAPSYIWFVFLRAMVGGGVSGHAQGLIIKTEFLPTKYRGYMLPLSQVFWLAGSLLIIGLASVVNSTISWRWLIRIASIPGILLILVFKFIPESARYNVSTGNTGAALVTLQRIASMNGVAMPEGQLREPAKERRGRFKDLIHSKYLRTTLQIWIIWLGIAFAYYGVILASAELLERDLVCASADSPLQDSSDDSEGSHSPCHCHLFGPAAYQTMIISTIGEIACLSHHNASAGDGDKWVIVPCGSNDGSIYITSLSHHNASAGDGDKWVIVPCGSNDGSIYITRGVETGSIMESFEEFRTGKMQLCHSQAVTSQAGGSPHYNPILRH